MSDLIHNDLSKDETVALTMQLINCPSVSPEDGGSLDIIIQRLTGLGFKCELFNRNGVKNLWAKRGNSGPCFCFAGHVDVVPTGPLDKWHTPPFTATIVNDMLCGRGAADMKGGVAASVIALETFIRRHPDEAVSLAVLITSDEEADAVDGTVIVVEALKARREHIDYCLLGEPTSINQLGDIIKNGRRGSLSGKLTINGIQGHIAYPHLSKNPVHLFSGALAELCRSEWDQGNEDYEPTTWQISNIHAGTGAGNVIPGQLTVDFNFRFSTASTVDDLKAKFHAIMARHNLHEGQEYQIVWTLGAKPFLTKSQRLIAATQQAVQLHCGIASRVETNGGTSDGRFLIDICDELLECGMVNATSHKINEAVLCADLPKLTAIYLSVMEALLLPPATH